MRSMKSRGPRLFLATTVLAVAIAGAGVTIATAGALNSWGSMMGSRSAGGISWSGRGMMGWNAGASCSPTAVPGQIVRFRAMDSGRMMGQVRMMRLMPYTQSVRAGDVTIELSNLGSIPHELLVFPLASGAGAGELSLLGTDRVAEDASVGEVEPVCAQPSNIDGVAAGNVARVKLHLQPGRYEVLCNLPGHYRAGMWVTLVVR